MFIERWPSAGHQTTTRAKYAITPLLAAAGRRAPIPRGAFANPAMAFVTALGNTLEQKDSRVGRACAVHSPSRLLKRSDTPCKLPLPCFPGEIYGFFRVGVKGGGVQRVDLATLRHRGTAHEIADAHQIVSRCREGEHLANLLQSAMP